MSETVGETSLLERQGAQSGAVHPYSAEQRQSRRLQVRIPLLLDWRGRRVPCWTVTANEGGALVTSPHPVEADQRVSVLNVTTGKTAVARVVAPLLADSGAVSSHTGHFRLALRLETFGVRFWGPVYYSALEECSRPSTP